MVGVEPAREDEHGAEAELEQRRQEVADSDPEERAAPVAREARVVGDERRPGNGHRDHDVDRGPERAVVAFARPDVVPARAVEDPPGQVGERRGDGPDRELADVPADEADRPEQRKRHRQRAEEQRPEPGRLEPEQLVAEQARGLRDHDQLEDRPAEALQHVQNGREVRASVAERRALEHHCRHASVCADRPRDRQQQISDHAADERGEERLAEREVEEPREDEDEQRDP